jgi:hypothetical protein
VTMLALTRRPRRMALAVGISVITLGLGAGFQVLSCGGSAVSAPRVGSRERAGAVRAAGGRRLAGARSGRPAPPATHGAPQPIGVGRLIGFTLA